MCWLDDVKKIKDREVDWNRKNEESQLLKVLPEAMYMFRDGLADTVRSLVRILPKLKLIPLFLSFIS